MPLGDRRTATGDGSAAGNDFGTKLQIGNITVTTTVRRSTTLQTSFRGSRLHLLPRVPHLDSSADSGPRLPFHSGSHILTKEQGLNDLPGLPSRNSPPMIRPNTSCPKDLA